MRKIFSLLAAVLFAGSMMADSYTISFKESGTENDSGTGLTSTTVADYVATGAEYVSAIAPSGKVYNARTGRGLKFGNSSNPGAVTLTLATPVNVTSIVVSAMRYKDGEASLKIQDKTDYVTTADLADYTYTYETATEVSEITVGTAAKRGYVKSVTVNFEGGVTPPQPAIVAPYCQTEVGHLFQENPDPNSFVLLSIGAANGKTIVRIDQDAAKNTQMFDYLQVTGLASEGADVAEGGAAAMAVEFDTPTAVNDSITLEILWSTVSWEGRWMIQNVKVPAAAACASAVLVEVPVELPDPTNCAEAAEAALSVSANNELYKDGAVYSITGYVTSIQTAYSDQYHNISFWMADAADGGNVLQAYRAACASAEDAPAVGDKVTVTGKLTKYGSTPEFAAGCTYTIVEKSAPATNLGAKTIAEFLALKNTKDTCILTGVVANITSTTYGNFDLCDEADTVYIYGLLTPAGESKKFADLNVAENDTLTVLAIYGEYNGKPQVSNAIFVEVKKYVEPVVFSHELYGSEALPVIDKTYFATGEGWAADADSHAEIVNDYDINVVLVASKASAWQSQVFVNPGFAWEVGAYYKMEFDLTTNHQLGGVHVKVNDDNTNFFYDSYPNDNIFLANQTTHYVADSIYAVVEPTNGGQLIFSVGWCDANTEILISNIVITKYEAPVVAQDINITLSSIENPGSLIWTDATATSGWWQIMGGSDSYGFSLSNAGEIAEAAGTYTVADLDPDYSYITLYGATDTVDVAFVDGSVTVAISEEGIVTVNGTLVGDDGNNYIFNLTYKDPVAEKTVELNIPAAELYDGYAAYGLYGVYGYTADNTSYVQLGIWTEEFAGDFTEDDLDFQYIGSGVIDADGTQSIFSAAITVIPGNGEGVYRITADLLCYNNTLYKVTMQIGIEQGIEDVDAAVKAIKSIVNGQLIIEKNGVQYNAQGAVIR